jgi:ribosome-associated protein
VLHLVSEESRSQHQNRENVIARFQNLLEKALRPRKKRKPTRPSRSARQRRLDKKRLQSKKKRDRKKVDW